LAQLRQRLAADERRDQKAVALQRASDLQERARQIVHGLQRKQRDGEIKPAIADSQALEVADRRQEVAISQARRGRGDPDDAIDLAAGRERRRAMRAGRAEVGGQREAPFDERQPIAKLFGRPHEQEIRLSAAARPSAIEAPMDQTSIEYLRRRRLRHRAFLILEPPLAQSFGSR